MGALRGLRDVRRTVPVVLMSGFSEQEALRRFTGEGLAGFVQKPFDAAGVLTTVRRVVTNAVRPG